MEPWGILNITVIILPFIYNSVILRLNSFLLRDYFILS